MKNRNNKFYFTKVNEFIKYVEDQGIPKGLVNAISAGSNGFYVFFWNGHSVEKTRMSFLGISYITTKDADDFINKNLLFVRE